ncbi:MAG: GDP-L-fucose synthase [Lachnospiraceae bacterium]|nr:GDP-L-fucose synthase [Lachnospiraceae bacterium]
MEERTERNRPRPLDRHGKIYVAGHRGLVGSALVRRLKEAGFSNILTRTHQELDLTRQAEVEAFFAAEKPDYVILAAAKVGGIHANNTCPADFIMENLQIQCNVIDASFRNQVKKLLFLGSSCIYPRECPQPIKEEYLLSGYLEHTNEGYALAKIAGLKMCACYNRQYGTDYISVMPCNLYGREDNFSLENSHVLPALLRKFHEARLRGDKTVTVWGSGRPLREFLHVDDLADACLFLLDHYQGNEFFNVGSGKEVTILELARLIQRITGFEGEIVWDGSKPDGTMRKVVDSSRLRALGWEPKIDLETGIRNTYAWFRDSYGTGVFAQR